MANERIDLVLITVGSQGFRDRHHLPLGILYIGSLLKSKGFAIHLHHLLPGDIAETMKGIAKSEPLLVGFSVLSGMTTYWSAIASKMLKSLSPRIKIVWGGHHATILADDCLKESYIDLVVRGEGEYTTLELAETLSANEIQTLSGIKGLSFKEGADKIIHNQSRPLIQNLDKLVLDYELLPMNSYVGIDRIRNVSLFSSRGCPFHCAFCSTPEFFGNAYRAHSSSYIINELAKLRDEYEINSVYFCDDNFYLDKKRAREIIKSMASMEINCDTLDVRLDQLTVEDLDYFKEYKVRGIFFGWESGNDRLLALMGKRLTTEIILEKANLIAKYGIPCWGSGMLLLPTETEEETRKTIDFSVVLRKILKGSTIGLIRYMPLPGTALTKLAIQHGFVMPKRQQDWKIVDPLENSYQTNWIPWLNQKLDRKIRYVQECSRNEMSQFKRKGNIIKRMAQNTFAAFLERRFKSLNFNLFLEPELYKLLRKLDTLLSHRRYEPLETKILNRSLSNLND